MGRQRNRPRTKEQQKSSEKEVNEMEPSNLPDIEVKTTVIRMLKGLRGTMDGPGENSNREILSIKRDIETILKNSHK